MFSEAQKTALIDHLTALQDEICAAIERLDGAARFREDAWTRAEGGGGRSRILEDGAVFEKCGVNFSAVHGPLPDALRRRGDYPPDAQLWATGVSLILHPRSPRIPTVHANFRALTQGDESWFGGGADLTPYYLEPDDATHFHRTLREACDRHDPAYYPRFKAWCDRYFFLPHRGEARGVGGIFFDDLKGDLERIMPFFHDISRAFLPAYLPIAERRRLEPWGERERTWQLRRRSRYVEFNLLYDRGTKFGLETGGRVESILVSLPPLVRNDYDVRPDPGSPEAALIEVLKAPREWL